MNRLSLPLLAAGLIALAASAFSPPSAPSADAAPVTVLTSATHTVTITYSGRRSTVRVVPMRGARAPWRGALTEGAVYSSRDKSWTTFKFEQVEDGVFEASARLPGSSEVAAFAVLTEAGSSYTWIEEDWPVMAQDDGDEKPEEPAPDDPEPDDPPEEGGLCNGIVDPWTGECDDEIRDPWEGEETTTQMMSFNI